ncbi:MAG: 1,4-dihydroxy-6-naphthoate synthase [Bacteroidetes bacterium RIFOXYA12_FULL_35_11]|nr:MAG: 1,4-dihydroxy-6-naphthoate synthase [Bacteroidetes bacterium GWF2_35_48]OFY81555.1 MAG: 1,4-dihydroxy-6-naphthoate synthase [Bacteroidetes bacterium RIFOXYA12_FULL_35_11]OFY94407.1 MAG: 1,4-dihydroxy-6-naphthoate synthase [Bacteroidetes bacterium RIFOXYC12_FULL_35_7]HBX50436.1 1,4-dihydroxy-6-naphthoate synthase [Bacteroidales bacterium]
MKLTIGFSTCPNDTFIFDALVNKKIDTEGLDFVMFLADVESLNKRAFQAELDITKLSFHAYAYVSEQYQILTAGGALGENNGPLLISKTKIFPDEIAHAKIGIPGKYTTANLLLGVAFPDALNKKEYIFSDIEDAVLSKEVDCGLIIHETRFTYQKKGLKKVLDIGEWWHEKTDTPVPLGCICVKRDLPSYIKQKVERVVKRSVEFAFNNPKESAVFVKKYAQELRDDVIAKHIELYVNNYSYDLGAKGKQAIETLFSEAEKNKIITKIQQDIFLS